jgi:hypothetical protein
MFLCSIKIYEENVRRAKNEGKQESAPNDHNPTAWIAADLYIVPVCLYMIHKLTQNEKRV